MADQLLRCRRLIWEARSTPPLPSQDLPAALLHLLDRYSRGYPDTTHPFQPGNQDTGRPQAKAAAALTTGMAWDIVDPISMPVTRG